MRFPIFPVLIPLMAAPAWADDPVGSLHGLWRGETLALALDVERGQARVGAEKPFQWERFIVKSVAGNQVVFTVGTRLYSATVDGDLLIVEATGYPGPQRLSRVVTADEAPPGAPAAGEDAAAPPGGPGAVEGLRR